jgi:hypothetical protein
VHKAVPAGNFAYVGPGDLVRGWATRPLTDEEMVVKNTTRGTNLKTRFTLRASTHLGEIASVQLKG